MKDLYLKKENGPEMTTLGFTLLILLGFGLLDKLVIRLTGDIVVPYVAMGYLAFTLAEKLKRNEH